MVGAILLVWHCEECHASNIYSVSCLSVNSLDAVFPLSSLGNMSALASRLLCPPEMILIAYWAPAIKLVSKNLPDLSVCV